MGHAGLEGDAVLRRISDRTTVPTAVPELAAKVAHGHGLSRLVTMGWPGWWAAEAYPNLSQVRLRSWPLDESSEASSVSMWKDSGLVADLRAQAAIGPVTTVIELVDRVPLALLQVDADAVESTVDTLRRIGREPTFVGQASIQTGETVGIVVVDSFVGGRPQSAPNDFRVLAIATVYNEIDIVESLVHALRMDGVDVHVVDNWSTDGTYELASHLAQSGAITLERFPLEPPATFNHGDLLRKIEEVARRASADWTIHHDADERRRPPWSGVTLRDALHTAQKSGFNAIDHTVLTFRPIDDTWSPGTDPEAHLRHFELEARPDLLLQIKAWRTGVAIDLATSGGHEVRFERRRVFPYRFLLKHYPLRSQEQAERKVFRERRARWNEVERAQGWHHHYDAVHVGQSFVWRREDLWEFVEGQTQRQFVVPFIGGAEVGQTWAASARLTAIEDAYMRAQRLRIQERLESLLGAAGASIVVDVMRRISWIARPFRRAWARRRWRQLGAKPTTPDAAE
jgi:hypothetical protein